MAEPREMPFRIALRAEGSMWNAYLARKETMDGAMLLGSIKLSIVMENHEHKEAFIALMQSVINIAIEEIVGVPAEFIRREGPDNERQQ